MKKEGSVRKKGNYTELRIWIDGKQKSFYGKSEAEARRKAREYRNSQNISNEKEFTKIDLSKHTAIEVGDEPLLLAEKADTFLRLPSI